MFRAETLSGGDGPLHLALGPKSGPPLLLLHGVTRAGRDFTPLVPSLVPRWTVEALDFRGHGASGRAPGRYLVADYVRDVVAALQREGPAPAIVYGHSLGAMVAAGAAAAVPDRVRALVLEDPPFETMGELIAQTQFLEYFAKMRALLSGERSLVDLVQGLADLTFAAPGGQPVRLGDVRDRAALRLAARCLADVDPFVLDPILERRWLGGFDRDGVFAAIQCPTLMLQADPAAGGMLTDDAVRSASERIRDLSVVRFERTGHLIHWLDTPALERAVLSFLASLE